jgi:FkbM family methyltransferase
MRVAWRIATLSEPRVNIEHRVKLDYFGNRGYGGWCVPTGFLDAQSVVVDVGLGEDISFSQQLHQNFRCRIHGFDPTPKAIAYFKKLKPSYMVLHEVGLAGQTRRAKFFLPDETTYVSGSITQNANLGGNQIEVELVGMRDLFAAIGADNIDVLKIDVEGAEYEIIQSEQFKNLARSVRVLCVEFHHRWPEFGVVSTKNAVQQLRDLGFKCVWRSPTSNEEFTFLRVT